MALLVLRQSIHGQGYVGLGQDKQAGDGALGQHFYVNGDSAFARGKFEAGGVHRAAIIRCELLEAVNELIARHGHEFDYCLPHTLAPGNRRPYGQRVTLFQGCLLGGGRWREYAVDQYQMASIKRHIVSIQNFTNGDVGFNRYFRFILDGFGRQTTGQGGIELEGYFHLRLARVFMQG